MKYIIFIAALFLSSCSGININEAEQKAGTGDGYNTLDPDLPGKGEKYPKLDSTVFNPGLMAWILPMSDSILVSLGHASGWYNATRYDVKIIHTNLSTVIVDSAMYLRDHFYRGL